MRSSIQTFLIPFVLLLLLAERSSAQGTAFSYQGFLTDNNKPASGSYDLQFGLFDSASGGASVAAPVVVATLNVTNGMFTVKLDFGAGSFVGGDRWIEIAARPSGAPVNFTPLAPRHPVTPTPYAIFAGGVNAAGISGTIPTNGISNGSITSNLLAPGAAAANLAAAGQSAVPSGAMLLSLSPNASNLTALGYATIGGQLDLPWQQRASAPAPRQSPTAIWTGSNMIVWGGADSNLNALNTGGVFDTVANRWTPTSTSNAPAARQGHTAVWAGDKMIIWGGGNGSNYFGNGALYDPSADIWLPTTLSNAPAKRSFHTAVWTGSEMIVWGGRDGAGRDAHDLKSGARYNPATQTWSPISTNGAPSARSRHTAVWTGHEMVVWGGVAEDTVLTPLIDGARYDPTTDTWLPISTNGAPAGRYLPTAVWTGSEMIVWGGAKLVSGVAEFLPTNGYFAPLPTNTIYVAPRSDGIDGVGSQSDPRDASTPEKIQALFGVTTNAATWFLLPGTYTITNQILINADDVHFIGSGVNQTIINVATNARSALLGTFYAFSSTKATNGNQTYFSWNCSWENFTLELNGHLTTAHTNAIGGFAVNGAHHIARNLRFNNPRGNSLTGHESWGIFLASFYTNIGATTKLIGGNVIENCQGFATNPISANPDRFYFDGYSIGAFQAFTNAEAIEYSIIRNCSFIGPSNHTSVGIVGFGYSITKNCTVTQCERGIYTEYQSSLANQIYRDNHFLNCHAGMWMNGNRSANGGFAIYDNEIVLENAVGGAGVLFTDSGVHSWRVTNVYLANNTISINATNNQDVVAFELHSLDDVTLSGNRIAPFLKRDGTDQIIIATSSNVFASGNTLFDGSPAVKIPPSAGTNNSGSSTDMPGFIESFYNNGARYNPATDSWTPISTSGAPRSRHLAPGVWTGTEMLVWGGANLTSTFNDGGRYHPASDTWSAIVANNLAGPRTGHTLIWNGSETLVFGGYDPGNSTYGDTFSYSPSRVMYIYLRQ